MNEKLIESLRKMSHGSVKNYVTPGLTSSLIGGDFHGMVRLFSSDRDTREFITPHSHRFDFTCLVLRGRVENILYVPCEPKSGNLFAKGTVKPLGEGMGKYHVEHGTEPLSYVEKPNVYGDGSVYSMTHDEIHSILFSRNAVVLFLEEPPVTEESVFLEPFSNGKVIHTFAVHPWMFEKE